MGITPTPTYTIPAYSHTKIKTNLWWAYHQPDLERHDPDLLNTLDGVYGRAWEHIQDGTVSTIPNLGDKALIELFLDIANYQPKKGFTEKLWRIRDSHNVESEKLSRESKSLPDAFLSVTGKQAVMALPEPPTAGRGSFPNPPERSNIESKAIGSVINLKPMPNKIKGRVDSRWSRKWELCQREYYFRVKREVEKAHAEMAFTPMYFVDGLSREDVERQINTWKVAHGRRKKKGINSTLVYCAYPYKWEGGTQWAIVSNQEKGAHGQIEADRMGAYEQFFTWVNTTEFERINKHSQQYGRHWQGMKNDGRVAQEIRGIAKENNKTIKQVKQELKVLQLLTDLMPKEVIKLLGFNGRNFELFYDELGEFANAIKSRIPDLKTKHGRAAWFAINDLKQAECTLLSPTKNSLKMVVQSRVHLGGQS